MEWISIKDRLPEKCGIYFICYEINGILKSHYSIWLEHSRQYKGSKFGWKSRGIIRRSNIQYWMPIPKPPIPASDP